MNGIGCEKYFFVEWKGRQFFRKLLFLMDVINFEESDLFLDVNNLKVSLSNRLFIFFLLNNIL